MTMLQAPFRTLWKRRVCVLQPQTAAQYSALEKTKDRETERSGLVPAPHPEPGGCLGSLTRVDSFLRNV